MHDTTKSMRCQLDIGLGLVSWDNASQVTGNGIAGRRRTKELKAPEVSTQTANNPLAEKPKSPGRVRFAPERRGCPVNRCRRRSDLFSTLLQHLAHQPRPARLMT
jgi:hypothetical protein